MIATATLPIEGEPTAVWWNLAQCLVWIGTRDLEKVNAAAELTRPLAAAVAIHGSRRRTGFINPPPPNFWLRRLPPPLPQIDLFDTDARIVRLWHKLEAGKVAATGKPHGAADTVKIEPWEWPNLAISVPSCSGSPTLFDAGDGTPKFSRVWANSADMMAAFPSPATAANATITMPAETGAFALAMNPAADTRPHSRRGPKPKYLWPDAEAHALKLLQERGEFRELDTGSGWQGQADLEREVLAFMVHNDGREPTESLVRQHVAAVIDRWRKEQAGKGR